MPKTLRIEHAGEANEAATPTEKGYAVQLIRKKLQGTVFEPVSVVQRIWRISSTGKSQYSDNAGESWTDADTLPDFPELPARTELTADERMCLAARNAAEILRLTYEEAVTSWNAALDPVDTAADVIALVGSAIGVFFVAPWAVLFAFGALLFDSMLDGLTGLLIGDWLAEDTEELTCRLLAQATANPDNTVTFNYQGVVQNIAGTMSIGGTQGFLEWMLSVIGEDGLNAAGATTSITTYDCTSCDNWCREFDLTTGLHGLTILNNTGGSTPFGTWVNGVGVVFGDARSPLGNGSYWRRVSLLAESAPACNLRRVKLGLTYEFGGENVPGDPTVQQVTIGNVNQIAIPATLRHEGANIEIVWEGNQNLASSRIVVSVQSSNNTNAVYAGNVVVHSLKLEGSGTSPYTTIGEACL